MSFAARIALFLLGSGFCALVYQIAWTRDLSLIFGASYQAVAVVLAAFMGGLALGRVRYDKWLRFTFPLLIMLFVLYAIVLSIGVFFPDSMIF